MSVKSMKHLGLCVRACALLSLADIQTACATSQAPDTFTLSGQIYIQGTAAFPQAVLADGNGKKWILECTKGPVLELQGHMAIAIVKTSTLAPETMLGMPRVCVQSLALK
jgi:hypothetical protein